MTITRLQILSVVVPTLGATALVITAYTVLSAQSQLKSTVISNQAATKHADQSKPAAEVKINGTPVNLDANGNASITTENGASIRIKSQAPIDNARASSQEATASTNIGVTYGGSGVAGNIEATVQHDESTNVRISGNSRTQTRTQSSTSIHSSGDGLIEINQSN